MWYELAVYIIVALYMLWKYPTGVGGDPFPYELGIRKTCKYAACPKCDACNVCRDFHGNFVAGCGDDCPYRWYHRVRDWFRRLWLRGI